VIGLCVLVAAAVLALALVWPAWLAALVIGGAALVLAGLAAMFGRSALRRSLPPVPLWAISSVRQDIDTIKKGARR
jgi:heme A synthase